ncbi:hypothetical protein [[Actinomadura] parvosata]|uniref:hypothetical protein n=1 Tax=[Actinomadura] parvosata TaxID=1955412 RepID=UPI001C920E69
MPGPVDAGRLLHAGVDAEEELPQEEHRERRHEQVRQHDPEERVEQPSSLISTKLGSVVKIGGTMRAVTKSVKTAFLPGQRSRAKA